MAYRGWLAAAFAISANLVLAAPHETVVSAKYTEPTTRYDHGILGDAVEWGALEMQVDRCVGCDAPDLHKVTLRLPDTHVFEDVAPRLVDLNGDGRHEVMVVETRIDSGARLAVYTSTGEVLGATPYIGRTHRWLAPVGATDMDGDGRVEVAYVDRPHLARVLRIWRFEAGQLVLVAESAGLTNHRIGDTEISGGFRTCNGVVEVITASADWSRVIATRLDGEQLISRDFGPNIGPSSFNAATRCGTN